MGQMEEKIRILAGAMSGTSADGLDVALVEIRGRGLQMSAKLLGQLGRKFPSELRQAILAIRLGKPTPISRLAQLGREISLCYAIAVKQAISAAGLRAADVSAIAAHGQTLFHDPPTTLQWLDPALIAAETGCAVVSDFRRADCAAGGQGAPLVPLADYLLFRDPKKSRVLLNIGGIANLTYLRAGAEIDQLLAFDAGPGNCISDYLMATAHPNGCGWDEDGALAARGSPVETIIKRMLSAPYFAKRPPKSTDGPAMVCIFNDSIDRKHSLEDLLSTACRVTADSIAQSMRRFLSPMPDEIIVSGGGTSNQTLVRMMGESLGNISLRRTDDLGIPSQAKEAMAFALLGAATLDDLPGNVPAATGAKCKVVLGSVTPQPSQFPPPRVLRESVGVGDATIMDRSSLLTERRLAESMELDRLSIEEALEIMNRQDAIAASAVASQQAPIAQAVACVAEALESGGRLIYVGAGTSGRLGVLDAAECPPTFGTDPRTVRGIIAGGERAMFQSVEGAEDRADEGAAAIDTERIGPLDVVLGIAAGGSTPFVHGALRRAAQLKARTIFLCCVEKAQDEPAAQIVIRPLTGPEVLTGSTRLKAGTATKLVLNQITTLAMVRRGKVYQNLMVDLRASNRKLWDRGARIVAMLTGLPRDRAIELLRRADGQAKVAIVMAKRGVDAASASESLKESGGRLRAAICQEQ